MTKFRLQSLVLLLTLLSAACAAPAQPAREVSVTLLVDGETLVEVLPQGSTARQAFESAGVALSLLDRSEPELDTPLAGGERVRLIRVVEEFETDHAPIPFEQRTLRNESLPVGELRLVQEGANGLAEVTYRLLYEDGELVSRTEVRSELIEPPVEEILMVGVEAPRAALPIAGRLALLSGGSAWLIEGSSANRAPLVATGDLDGRVFALSPDGNWLLFSRASNASDAINSLWVVNLNVAEPQPIPLGVENVVHFAGWVPGEERRVVFSTAQFSAAPPGWLANNDLQSLAFDPEGGVGEPAPLLSPRAEGLYAWWGSDYAWAPDGGSLAYSRPDGVGLVDASSDTLNPLLPLLSYQTESEWAWMPSLSWSPNGTRLYTVLHAETPGLVPPERSPLFDLVALDHQGGQVTMIAGDVGMFANPAASPQLPGGSHLIAFLQARNPGQSDVSDYQLVVVDTESTRFMGLFPPDNAFGLEPQRLVWSPSPEVGEEIFIALIYHNNLWLVNAESGAAHQITADGLAARVDWVR